MHTKAYSTVNSCCFAAHIEVKSRYKSQYCTDAADDRIWHWITIILTYNANGNGDNRKRNGINFLSQLLRLVSHLTISVFVRWPCKRHAAGLTNTAASGAFAYCSVNRRRRAISSVLRDGDADKACSSRSRRQTLAIQCGVSSDARNVTNWGKTNWKQSGGRASYIDFILR